MKYLRPRSGPTSRLALLAVTGSVIAALTLTMPAIALPTFAQFGGQLFYTGGDVTVEVLYHDTDFSEFLQIWSGSTAINLADCSQTGTQVTLTQQQLADMGIAEGDELMFGIHVEKTNLDYILGPGDRNSDGIDHAYIRSGGTSIYAGFEDLYGGGDRDYNDAIFRFSGVKTNTPEFGPTSVPEPASICFLMTGIGLLGLAYRRR